MSQETVYRLLEKTKRWMSALDISKILGLSPNGIRLSCRKLFRQGHITVKDVPGIGAGKRREYKIREVRNDE